MVTLPLFSLGLFPHMARHKEQDEAAAKKSEETITAEVAGEMSRG